MVQSHSRFTLLLRLPEQLRDPIFTASKRSLGKGNVFTHVCLSTGRKGFYDVTSCYGQHSPNSTHPPPRWCPSKRSNVLLIKTVMLMVRVNEVLALQKVLLYNTLRTEGWCNCMLGEHSSSWRNRAIQYLIHWRYQRFTTVRLSEETFASHINLACISVPDTGLFYCLPWLTRGW